MANSKVIFYGETLIDLTQDTVEADALLAGYTAHDKNGETITGTLALFAVISVTYPAGSVCTCTKGTKTYKAKNTSGLALFAVPEVGDWTVSCTDGTKTASKTVTISADGEAVSVELAYELVLFSPENGALAYTLYGRQATGAADEPGVTASITNDNLYIYFGDDYYSGQLTALCFENSVDLTKYSKITIKYTATYSHENSYASATLNVASSETGADVASVDLAGSSQIKTVALDVASLAQLAYIRISRKNKSSWASAVYCRIYIKSLILS